MNKYYHLAQRFLKHGPIIIWVIMNLVLGIGIAFGYGLINAIVFLVNFLGMGTLIIGLFGYRLFPALMEFSEKNKKINIKKWLVALMLLIVTGVALHMFHSKFINLSTEHYMPAITRIVVWLSFIVLGMMLVASIQLTQHYYNSKISEIRLEADKVKAELSILKNQISPHFLFNTLNNIYGLAYMGDKKSATMISKLSQIMRYLIYDCNQEKVLLAREKELIGHYLNLQGLKYEAGKNIDFYEEGIDDQASVPPMILINFVENCFKHSDIETNPNAWIKISLELHGKEFNFRTENTTKKRVGKVLFEQRGIGLTNSRKLLEAHYPERHQLTIEHKNDTYIVNLNVAL